MRRNPGLAALAAAAILATAAPPAPAAADTFPDVSRIETALSRGVSTTRDVEALLGVPDGIGSAMFPPDHRTHKVWFYENIEILGMASEGEVTRVSVTQEILLVFFDGGIFDGFSWSSSRLPGDVR